MRCICKLPKYLQYQSRQHSNVVSEFYSASSSRKKMANPPNRADVLSMILVMGVTGSGKSYFINQLAGGDVVNTGGDLKSCKSPMHPLSFHAYTVLNIH